MAEQLQGWTRSPEALSSSPALTASWIASWSSQVKFSTMLVNSQLVHLLPTGILNSAIFYLNLFLSLSLQSTITKGRG